MLNNKLCHDKQRRDLILILFWSRRTETHPSMGVGLNTTVFPVLKLYSALHFVFLGQELNVPPVHSAKQIFNCRHVKLCLQNINCVKHKVYSPKSPLVCADLFAAGRILQLRTADHGQKIPFWPYTISDNAGFYVKLQLFRAQTLPHRKCHCVRAACVSRQRV